MKAAVTKAAEVFRLFKENLHREYEANPVLAQEVKVLRQQVGLAAGSLGPVASIVSAPFADFYRCLHQGSSAAVRTVASQMPSFGRPSRARVTTVDKVLEKSLDIPQYYGGIRESCLGRYARPRTDDNHRGKSRAPFWGIFQSGARKSLGPLFPRVQALARYLRHSRTYGDYKVLEEIENVKVPQVMLDLFTFKELKDVSQDARNNLKRLRSGFLSAGMMNAEIELVDLRQTNIECVSVKNFKKVVTCGFEFTVVVQGEKSSGGVVKKHKHYSGLLEFSKDDNGRWTAASFSYEEL